MKRILLLSLLASLFCVTTAEARLFWQTYGSVVPSEDGCGCTWNWNWNQDYFVPRHSSSCRYGLFSPCKTSHTNSPACGWCHPFHSGYCGIYGPWHYHRKNHVYKASCGCEPLCASRPRRAGCGKGCYRNECGPACGGAIAWYSPEVVSVYPLPNVETPGLEGLGSIPVEGDGLLANVDLTPLDDQDEQRVFIGPQSVEREQVLPSLGNPTKAEATQP